MNFDPVFKPVPGIYESRLRQFTDPNGDYRGLNLPKFYNKKKIDLDQNHVRVQWYQVDFEKGSSPVSPDKRPSWKSVIEKDQNGDLEFKDATLNQPFGPSWSTTWFKVSLKLPKEWVESGEQLIFEWDSNNEGIVIDPKTMIPATAFSGNGERTEYLLPKNDNGEFFFYIETGNNGMFGCGIGSTINPPDDNKFFHLRKAAVVWPDWDSRALFIDFWMLSDAARELPNESWQKHRARQIGNELMNLFDPEDRDSVQRCREFIHKEFYDEFVDSPDVYTQGDDKIIANVFSMGNCHIDTAWLWPFAETRRKIVRSWSSQCTLMDEYPEYQFVASQAQQFKWLLEDHPEFFNEVLKKKVEQHQFIPIGGSWVENDTNIPSGESLARQFFYGQRFFMKQFGIKSNVFWLPDTFGYSSQVPQICKLSGIERFLTQKLSWNNINSFPHSTFNWAGIDGSQLLTHMPPGNTYTADSHFGDVLRTAKQNKSMDFYESGLMLYGKGDGGGGPTREMLEKMRRIRSISNRNGNVIPKLDVGTDIDDFYADIMRKTQNAIKLPTWNGELYFEFHRGTYTSQANTKAYMRLSEIKIHDLEALATFVSVLFSGEYKYPSEKINDLWENILLCQFHDVLPGTCIEIVYKYEAIPMLERVVAHCDKYIKELTKFLITKGEQGTELVNTMTWVANKKKLLDSNSGVVCSESSEYFKLKNSKVEVTINKATGVIVSIFEVDSGIEYLDIKNGRNNLGANQFVVFDDKPLSWQAWDTELYSVEQYNYVTKLTSIECHSDSVIRSEYTVFDDCSITSDVSLTPVLDDGTYKINIKTNVKNWTPTNKFLKVEFPVNVRNEYASYETQFGLTKRPTHYNTTWDVAKFEVCSHKFADYSEYSKGVSILNNSKYGFSTHGNLMRLSLLRSPKAPDAHADMGDHEIEYAIFPHKGPLNVETVRLAHEFNYRFNYSIPSNLAEKFKSMVNISGDTNVILSNVKRGEEDSDIASNYALCSRNEKSIVIRVYEALGGESQAMIHTFLDVERVTKICNLELETYETLKYEKTSKGFSIPIKLRPFEIASYKIVFN